MLGQGGGLLHPPLSDSGFILASSSMLLLQPLPLVWMQVTFPHLVGVLVGFLYSVHQGPRFRDS